MVDAPISAEDYNQEQLDVLVSLQQQDQATLGFRLELSSLFTFDIGSSNTIVVETAYDLVDETQDGFDQALAELNEYRSQALDPENGEFFVQTILPSLDFF